MEWGLVVPVKSLSTAKSRLHGRSVEERAALALAFARDTLAVAVATTGVVSVVVVTDDPSVAEAVGPFGVRVVDDGPDPGLNAALLVGAQAIRGDRPGAGVGALVADLPALRTEDLGRALAAAAGTRGYVSDRTGEGTTLVTAPPGHDLQVRFGRGSAGLHRRAGLRAIGGGLPTLRCDVDSEEDLVLAQRLGLGPATSAWLAAAGGTDGAP